MKMITKMVKNPQKMPYSIASVLVERCENILNIINETANNNENDNALIHCRDGSRSSYIISSLN